MVAKKHDIVRVMGEKKRIYRGTERRDRIRMNGKVLKGFVCFRRQSGEETVTTCFPNRKQHRMERVEGSNWQWLARKNNRTVKLVIEVKPIYEKGDFTQEEVLQRVEKGEISADQAQALLV